jgi:hypothetical protein
VFFEDSMLELRLHNFGDFLEAGERTPKQPPHRQQHDLPS